MFKNRISLSQDIQVTKVLYDRIYLTSFSFAGENVGAIMFLILFHFPFAENIFLNAIHFET